MFLSDRGNINYEEVKSNLDRGEWRLGYDANSKIIVLEDLNLEIESPEKVINSKILSGGLLSKQIEEKDLAISQRKIPDFIKKYPDSPISISVLQNSIRFYNLDLQRAESRFGYPKELFASLSERLRFSKQGLLLKQAIDDVYKP